MHDDPIFLVDVLYRLCKSQADSQNVSDEDFGRAMFGDAILHAQTAFIEERSDFFPSARQRAAIKKVIGKTTQVVDRLLDPFGCGRATRHRRVIYSTKEIGVICRKGDSSDDGKGRDNNHVKKHQDSYQR